MAAVKPQDFTPLDTMRHSAAHVMAAAVLELWPDAKLGVGPVIENGFYYDIGMEHKLTPVDLAKIEKRMGKIMQRDEAFAREEMSIDAAIAFFAEKGQDFKVELLKDLKTRGTTAVKEDESGDIDAAKPDTASIYRTGEFVDLCRGPHVTSSKGIGAVKLKSVAGAYWRGREENAQLQRVYGYAFPTQKELDAFLLMLEEAEKRDHRKLGQELELFSVIPEIGLGLPLFYPKGALVRRLLEEYIITEQEKRGYVPIWIPHITKGALYAISGHLDKYDAMYAPMTIDEDQYYLKPMNCPHFMMLYKQQPHSYRELPMRWTCTTTNYRYEKHGELSGLTRVRSLTQDDCHVFCSADQIGGEIALMLEMIGNAYKTFALTEFWVRVSLRDPKNPDKYLGGDAVWGPAEAALREAVQRTGWTSREAEGEAAFYGPKLDFMVRDAIGREWQLSTIQLDFNLPERFDLDYMGDDGVKHRPVVIHRAILGSTERFMGILIEHFAGAFPLWLAPVQVAVIPVGESHVGTAQKLTTMLTEAGIRTQHSEVHETVGNRIRKASKMKVPYMIVVGDKEAELADIMVRVRGKEEEIPMRLTEFIAQTNARIKERSTEL